MKYVKFLLPVLLVALMLLVPGQAFAAEGEIQLYLNDKKLKPEVAPRIVNEGTTIVPLRIISEELEAKVTWFDKERKVKIEREKTTIEMKIDDPIAYVNGKSLPKLDAAPTIIEDNTLVPIRFIAEQFGLKVGWDGSTQSVLLYKMAQESATSDDNGGQAQNGKDGSSSTGNSNNGNSNNGNSNSGTGNNGTTDKGTTNNGSTNNGSTNNGSANTGTSNNGTSNNGTTNNNGTTGNGTANNGNTNSGTSSGKPDSGAKDPGGSPAQPGGSAQPNGNGNTSGDKSLPTLSKLELSGESIVFQTTGDVVPKTSVLSNPYRIVIDLPGLALGSFAKPGNPGQGSEIAVQHPKVDKIRYALFSDNPSTVRIVLDMKQRSGYQLTETKVSKQWTISLVDKQFTVVIDAGHGGSDPGASSLSSRKEKDFTLPVANKVYKLLQQEPSIRTLMTRTDDTYPTLDERVELANGQNADLFVSIHGNSFKEKPTVSGTETYYNRADSLTFANTMHKWILEATTFPDRGVRQGDLKVTRETTMPAILLEIGYLSNAGDEARMYSDSFQDKLAVAIVNGIKEQLQITSSTASVKNAASGSEDKSSQAKAAGAGTVKTASEAGDKSVEQQTASKPKEETAADKTLQPAK